MKALRLGGAVLGALVFACPAVAAPLAYSWTGFYLGGSIGGRWADPDWTTTCLTPGFGPCPLGGLLPTRFAFNNPATFDSTSLRGSIYGGYNWQFAPMWVVGIEGDFGWAKNSKTISGIPGAEEPTDPRSPGLDTSTVKQTWDAGIRGRLGFLINPTLLLFATGGASWTRLDAIAFCGTSFQAGGWCDMRSTLALGHASTLSKTLTGWTMGGGIEWMLAPQWLVRGEYRYADYGTLSGTFFSGFTGFTVNGDAIAADVKLRTHTALFGIAYRFGG